jgi:hypothetical protein
VCSECPRSNTQPEWARRALELSATNAFTWAIARKDSGTILVEKERRASRRWRTIALLAIGVAIGATLTATPVYSHVGGTVTHLWSKHIRPKTDALYHTKAAADTRYVNVGEKATAAAQADSAARAADADTFDGV